MADPLVLREDAGGARTDAEPDAATVVEPATAGLHERVDGVAGWWLITDGGSRAFAPEPVVQGYRTLRPGQRVELAWTRAGDGTARVLRVAPPRVA